MSDKLTPQEILMENGVSIVRSKLGLDWEFEYKGKRIPQPAPFRCYDTLIREFEITEPRLKDWR